MWRFLMYEEECKSIFDSIIVTLDLIILVSVTYILIKSDHDPMDSFLEALIVLFVFNFIIHIVSICIFIYSPDIGKLLL